MTERSCRIDGTGIDHVEPNANRSIVGNHPLAIVAYRCGHWEFVRHDQLTDAELQWPH